MCKGKWQLLWWICHDLRHWQMPRMKNDVPDETCMPYQARNMEAWAT